MKGSLLVLSLLAIFCLTLAGCGPGLPTLTISEIPWPDDEVTSYTVDDLEGNTTGTCWLTVHKDGDSYILTDRSELTIEGTEVTDDTSIRVSATALKPISGIQTIQTPDAAAAILSSYSEGKVSVTVTVDGQEESGEFSVPPDGYDNAQVLFLLRTIPFEVGYAATFSVVVPSLGVTPRATITVVGEEMVEVPFALESVDCYKIELSIAGITDKQYFWYGVNGPHYLVKVESAGIIMLLETASIP